jgi:hypothetical protein
MNDTTRTNLAVFHNGFSRLEARVAFQYRFIDQCRFKSTHVNLGLQTTLSPTWG